MVVVSGSWMKNATTYLSPSINNDVELILNEKKMARAILICRPNSHHFQERTLALDQPVKVGRSVARAKPTPTNAIFDCKVLSRHHALLWYEDGKFYLQDTKSSNGTFVNNNRLTADTENHELSSGDIVQFGVDVVENNRKVTHGCIIATIKLYLPDGKEAKASPSITDNERQGIIPLDELYRLSQVIQEANQREQCLETKLTALQQIIDETRKSTEENWQVYVGEERLLSRVSALENQLQQIGKSWGEDRLKEELIKSRENNETYQIAAKEALEKLHTERLEAVALAMEQERARIAAEQEALLAKEQFVQAQLELQEVVQKLTEHQKKTEEQRIKLEQREQDLEARLEKESEKLLDLQLKLHELNALPNQEFQQLENVEEKHNKICGDFKTEEEALAENEISDSVLNTPNGINNRISLMVHPVLEKNNYEVISKQMSDTTELPDNGFSQKNILQDGIRKVNFKVITDCKNDYDSDASENNADQRKNNEEQSYKEDSYNNEHIDSKTLKYQFQSAQNELKRKIELLESMSNINKSKIEELNKALNEEKDLSHQRLIENENLKQELFLLQQKWIESCNENQQYKDKIKKLVSDLETSQEKLKGLNDHITEKHTDKSTISNNAVVYDNLVNLEEELVLLKERFAQVGEEKIRLQHELLTMTENYNMVCNRSYNKYFFYVAPLVFMVLYLLVSAMIS